MAVEDLENSKKSMYNDAQRQQEDAQEHVYTEGEAQKEQAEQNNDFSKEQEKSGTKFDNKFEDKFEKQNSFTRFWQKVKIFVLSLIKTIKKWMGNMGGNKDHRNGSKVSGKQSENKKTEGVKEAHSFAQECDNALEQEIAQKNAEAKRLRNQQDHDALNDKLSQLLNPIVEDVKKGVRTSSALKTSSHI